MLEFADADSTSGNHVVERFNQWTLNELRPFNSLVISKKKTLAELVTAMNALLQVAPDPENLSVLNIQQLLVILGVWGSSVGRHYQEEYPETKTSQPDAGISLLRVGLQKTAFRAYFNSLAELSGTGHPPRDAYASLVRWNTGTMRACWKGETVARLPSVFNDARIRTYTDDIGETLILELFKRCETLEKAANNALKPLWDGGIGHMDFDEMRERFILAMHMLAGIQRFMLDFPFGDERGKLTPNQFIDVFRQFAIHWDTEDIPPSGPQDTEFIKRDLLIGMGLPRYVEHVRRIFPGLLEEERKELSELFGRKALPVQLLENAGTTLSDFNGFSKNELEIFINKNPIVSYCFFFLRANSHLSAAHLMLAKRFLFKPIRIREKTGLANALAPVSNEMGITGLTEGPLERLNNGRRDHVLTRLDQFTNTELFHLSGIGRCPELTTAEALGLLGIER